MTQPATTNMALVLPTPGGDAGAWGDVLNTAQALIDGHDHSTGKGVQITPSGLNINADLTFGTNSATHLKSADFDEIAAPSSGARRIFWNSADHELYVRTAGGVNVKLTNGASINVSIVGGIGGDYASAGALLSYDDATRRYLLQQEGSPRPWAGLATADIDLYQKAASITNRVRQQSPAALAASYAVTWFAALPADQEAVQVDNFGQMFASNTFPVSITAPDYLLSAAQTITIASGAVGVDYSSGTHTRTVVGWTFKDSTQAVIIPIQLKTSDIITGFSVEASKASDNTNTIAATLWKVVGGSNSSIASGSNNTSAPGSIVLSPGAISHTVASNEAVYIALTQTDSTPSAFDAFYNVYVNVKR